MMETRASRKGKEVENETSTLEKNKSGNLEKVTLMEEVDCENDNQVLPTTMAEPVQRSNEAGEPPFFKKLRKLVDDPETDSIISWSVTKESVVIWNNYEFCTIILPKFYRHNNLSSFIRQLNNNGFRKMNRERDKSEYAHKDFRGGQEHLVNSIKNRYKEGGCDNNKPNLDIDESNLQAKIDKLKSYTNTVKVEIMEIKQHQECIRSYVASLKKRSENKNEHKKQQISILLDKAFSNRVFFNQFTKLMREKNVLGYNQTSKKRRLEDQPSINNINRVENEENQNEEEVFIDEPNEKEPVSNLVEHEGAPSEEQKAEKVVDWESKELYITGSRVWDTILLDELNRENDTQARAGLEKLWQEEVIFVDPKL